MGILANNEGKILRSNQTGEVLKQNYNFGSTVYNNGINSIYLSVPYMIGRNISTPFSFFLYTKNSGVSTSYGFFHVIGNNDYRVSSNSDNGVDRNRIDYFFESGSGIGISIDQGLSVLTAGIFDNTNVKCFYNSTIDQNNYSGGYINNVNKFLIGASPYRTGISLAKFMNSKIGTFEFYERALTDDEYLFRYNNGLGNEVKSNVNLILKYDMEFAEILDFSIAQDGSDLKVGIRNKGSVIHAHAEILGLPSGTLQEQLDYANANLFETW